MYLCNIMFDILNNILFLINTFLIIGSETILYLIMNNYNLFIERIIKRLAECNILYVKVFQSLSFNNKLIDDKINNNFLKFTDNVPYNSSDIDFNTLTEVSKKFNIHIENFNKPINSGMISLVYLGKQREDNSNIIIKIKRKNIDLKLKKAINNLLFCIKFLKKFWFFEKYNISELIHKNIDIICHQTNFNEEVKNLILIKNNCSNIEYVKIPFVYDYITKLYDNVIIMEYINGLKLSDVPETDYYEYSKLVLKFGIVTSMLHGLTHGDLHAGNILFIKDTNDKLYNYKIGVIDFGIIYSINDTFREKLFDIIINMFNSTSQELSQKLLNCGVFEPKDIINTLPREHYTNIINILIPLIDKIIHQKKEANLYQLYNSIFMLFNYLNKHNLQEYNLKISNELIKLQLVLNMTHGMSSTLCKDNYIKVAEDVIEDLFHIKLLQNYKLS